MGIRGLLEMLLSELVKTLPDRIATLRSAVINQDLDGLVNEAHTLKGSSANLSADRISSVAQQLEQMGRNGNLKKAEMM